MAEQVRDGSRADYLCHHSHSAHQLLVGAKGPIVRLFLRHRGKGPNRPMCGTRINISVLSKDRPTEAPKT